MGNFSPFCGPVGFLSPVTNLSPREYGFCPFSNDQFSSELCPREWGISLFFVAPWDSYHQWLIYPPGSTDFAHFQMINFQSYHISTGWRGGCGITPTRITCLLAVAEIGWHGRIHVVVWVLALAVSTLHENGHTCHLLVHTQNTSQFHPFLP